MKHMVLKATLVTVAAAGSIATLPASAQASPAAATQHCSTWKEAGSTHYFVRACAQIVRHKKDRDVVVTAYFENRGHRRAKVSGSMSATWHQAAAGETYTDVTVAPGHRKSRTDSFETASGGPYKATVVMTVAHHSATVHSSFAR